MKLFNIGLDALGGDALSRTRIKSANTAGYVLPDLSDASAKTLGDGDPAFKFDKGIEVSVVGPSAKNANGVEYTPVRMIGQDDNRVIWVRSTSIEPIAIPTMSKVPVPSPSRSAAVAPLPSPTSSSGRPAWQYALMALGAAAVVGVVGYTVYKIASNGQKKMRFA